MSPVEPTGHALARMIDISAVQAQHGRADVEALARHALAGDFVAAHVLPSWVPVLRPLLDGSHTNAGSPVGFPSGGSATPVKVTEARWLLDAGVQEMDVVMNVGLVRSGELAAATRDVAAVLAAVDNRVPVKVILEVGLLDEAQLRDAARVAVDAGAASLKTGTGWQGVPTTPEHVRVIREIAGPNREIKASGGIRSLAQLHALLDAGATRFGINTAYAVQLVAEATP
ncbi:deoxyribose-phosphate aldolase [Micromonospora sp. NBRC 101691]|uniref:deoxyribose-phosphate aldolase n=1 Tax=Micromonospora sp. NBRC 101691 TaxID=3032198 RepID=UPI0024A2332B|nr:deoxyribose-phosphate aldolase [Micromonospora sp. NBRC 101691]GLY20342.1 deoxyribose-phosphate aldolase [Micromonospora sp. NBRC 101691]